ncbi:MAG: UPF0175 family protein [Bacteroidetes bacterium]|nr:UPF0175 family protein [Bacteroidota bacterium]
MSEITLNLPDNLTFSELDLKMWIAAKLYEEGKLSSGQAALMVGVSKRVFIELLAKYKVSLFNYDLNEIEADLNNEF